MVDIETMSSELIEINNIVGLAKADDDIKKVLLGIVAEEFYMELQDMFFDIFGSNGLLNGNE